MVLLGALEKPLKDPSSYQDGQHTDRKVGAVQTRDNKKPHQEGTVHGPCVKIVFIIFNYL